MLKYTAINGQSLHDICLSTYGDLGYMLKLIKNNNIDNINYRPISGDVFMWDETAQSDPNVNIVSSNGNTYYATAVPVSVGIVSYIPFADITTSEGGSITLPPTATVTYIDGHTAIIPVQWGSYSTATAGNYVMNGVATDSQGSFIAVVVNLIVTALTDLDILRQIRDANPTSQLPALWLDSKDPYTQWEGVQWTASRVSSLIMSSIWIRTLHNVNKLTALQTLDCYENQLTTLDVTGLTALQTLDCGHNQLTTFYVTGLTALQTLYCYENQLTTLDVTGLTALQTLHCSKNQLTAVPSLTSKGLITDAKFTYNLMQPTETNRLLALGFTTAQVLPQDI